MTKQTDQTIVAAALVTGREQGRKAYAKARRRYMHCGREFRNPYWIEPRGAVSGTAAACLAEARKAATADKPKTLYTSESIWRDAKGSGNQVFSAYGEKAMLWLENPESVGLRLVGHADELASLRHNGWFIDSFQGETVRGVVYLLPGRNGKTRAIGGYADPCNDGAACLSLEIFESDSPDSSWDAADCLTECARNADGIAERMADESRAYDSAWQAGSMARQSLDEAQEARRQWLAIRKEAKETRTDGRPALCAAIAAQLDSLADTWREAKETAAKLARGESDSWDLCWNPSNPDYVNAFEEGRG